jgi:hypothetical protein
MRAPCSHHRCSLPTSLARSAEREVSPLELFFNLVYVLNQPCGLGAEAVCAVPSATNSTAV